MSEWDEADEDDHLPRADGVGRRYTEDGLVLFDKEADEDEDATITAEKPETNLK